MKSTAIREPEKDSMPAPGNATLILVDYHPPSYPPLNRSTDSASYASPEVGLKANSLLRALQKTTKA